MSLRIFDWDGTEIVVGSRVDDASGIGEVTLCGEDEGRVVVLVDFGRVVERFLCSPRNYRKEGPEPENWVALDLKVIGAPKQDRGSVR